MGGSRCGGRGGRPNIIISRRGSSSGRNFGSGIMYVVDYSLHPLYSFVSFGTLHGTWEVKLSKMVPRGGMKGRRETLCLTNSLTT